MSSNLTNDDLIRAREFLDSAEVPFPRCCQFRGGQYRILSPGDPPEFRNDLGEWQPLEPT